jgi:hypothetical protein
VVSEIVELRNSDSLSYLPSWISKERFLGNADRNLYWMWSMEANHVSG